MSNSSELVIREVVYLDDPNYFCNKSWTLSFNVNTKSWVSFHSYIPNWYIGENNFFYSGLNTGCDLHAIAVQEVPATTTSTTTYIPNCDLAGEAAFTYPVVECLNGLIVETIYLDSLSDLDLIPSGYEHPCPDEIGSHGCNRALFEIYGNGVYIGDSKINNAYGTGGGETIHGTYICQDYYNVPNELEVGGFWTGSPYSRYNKIIITSDQAIDISNAGGGGNIVGFSLISAMTEYGATCDDILDPHSNVTWTRISKPDGTVIYNGCPEGNFAEIDVCATP